MFPANRIARDLVTSSTRDMGSPRLFFLSTAIASPGRGLFIVFPANRFARDLVTSSTS